MRDRAMVEWAMPPGGRRPANRARSRFATVLFGGLCGGLLSACAVSVPMGGDDGPTGSVRKANPSPFSADMDPEDWRRAKSALDTALDPQGNGASVAWDNPASGAHGSFAPSAQPYPKDDGICRPFTAHLALRSVPDEVIHASACRVNSGAWVIGRVTPAAPSPGSTKR